MERERSRPPVHDDTDANLAAAWVAKIARDFTDASMPFEVRRLGRAIAKWAAQIVAWHQSHVSSGPTEAINNQVKRLKRTAFGFRPIRAIPHPRSPLRRQAELRDSLTNSPHPDIKAP